MKIRNPKSEIRKPAGVSAALALVLKSSVSVGAFPADQSVKLLPPYGELPPTFWQLHGTSVAVLALALVLVAALVAWGLLRPKPPVILSPEIQARKALEDCLHHPENGAALSRISQVLRRYVIAVFELPPGEPTTTEFCRLLSSTDSIGSELSGALSEFLRRCDERKFAPQPPAEPLDAAARALELVTLGEARRAHLRQAALAQTKHPSPATA